MAEGQEVGLTAQDYAEKVLRGHASNSWRQNVENVAQAIREADKRARQEQREAAIVAITHLEVKFQAALEEALQMGRAEEKVRCKNIARNVLAVHAFSPGETNPDLFIYLADEIDQWCDGKITASESSKVEQSDEPEDEGKQVSNYSGGQR